MNYRTRALWSRVFIWSLGVLGAVCILSSVSSFADNDITGLSLYTGFFGMFSIVTAACYWARLHKPPTQ